MSDLIAPRLIGQKQILNKYGKVILEREFILPNETTVEYVVWGVTVTPSIVFPIIETPEDITVIAVHQFRYGANEFVLEVPGGCPQPGQSPEEVASRELFEETGYAADQMIRLGTASLWFEPAVSITNYIPFLARGCKKVADPKPEQDEVLEVRLIPMDTWLGMIKNGQIHDSKTIAVTMLALLFLA